MFHLHIFIGCKKGNALGPAARDYLLCRRHFYVAGRVTDQLGIKNEKTYLSKKRRYIATGRKQMHGLRDVSGCLSS
jgi:hypothetical protein